MQNKLLTIITIGLLFQTLDLAAQKASVSTNLAGYVNLATLNIETSFPVSRHWSICAGAKYNPFTFNLGKGREDARSKQQAYYAGTRYGPWNVYSGWWLSGKVMYQEYNTGGIFSPETREGDRIGMSLGGGYSHMIGKRLNIEFGAGIWSGMDWFTKYSCPVCGNVEASGKKVFILPSDIIVALSYIF